MPNRRKETKTSTLTRRRSGQDTSRRGAKRRVTLPRRLALSRAQLSKFCRRWHVSEMALFGSALSNDFRADSDVDVLVTFEPTAHPTLFDLARMQSELQALFGRKVDLLTRRGVESSRNPIRRAAILSSAETVYVA